MVCLWPEAEQNPQRPEQRFARLCKGTACQAASEVRLRQADPNWQQSKVIICAD